jgi:Ni2+-binding GTPase involved in maturation of urease and hydrogenase
MVPPPGFQQKGALLMADIPSVVFIGGFLGAGKTTAIRALAKLLARKGLKAAAITNDQAAGLVDTVFLAGEGLATEEVAGSCFCCNFDGLVRAIQHSIATAAPKIILAEPVGSCTDIVATVILPLQNLMRDQVKVHAFSVLVEPLRWKELGLEAADTPCSMKYLFHKQVEESDFVVLTKTDTISKPALEEMKAAFIARYPYARLLSTSSRDGRGLETWLEAVLSTPPGNRWLKDIDYATYAQAEADMGWLNAEADLIFPAPVDGRDIAVRVALTTADRITQRKGKIGHLKLLAVGPTGGIKAGITVAGQGGQLDGSFSGPVSRLHITLNARATISPGELAEIVISLMADFRHGDGAQTDVSYLNTFRPAAPNPTHRYSGQECP